MTQFLPNLRLLICSVYNVTIVTLPIGYGGVSSKTTTASDSSHMNGFLPNGSNGGVWTGETLSSLSGKSSSVESREDDDDIA